MPDRDPVEATIAAINALNISFRAERYAYLLGVVAGVGLLLFAAYKSVVADQITVSTGGTLFGAGGIFTLTSARILTVFNRAYGLVAEALKKQGAVS